MTVAIAVQDLMFSTEAPSLASTRFALLSMEGEDRISQPYRYRLLVQLEGTVAIAAEDVAELMNARCQFSFGREGTVDTVHGVVTEVEQLSALPNSPISYELVVEPRLSRLAQARRSRVFQSMSYPHIVRTVLGENGLVEGTDVELRLERGARRAQDELPEPGPSDDDFAAYRQREYTVQYQESDLDFVQRLLEHDGLFYFFTQDGDRELMVIADANTGGEKVDPMRFDVNFTDQADPVVPRLSHRFRIGPETLSVRDYNWRTPSVRLAAEHEVDATTGFGLHAAYGDHFRDDDDATFYARIRAEEVASRREVVLGESTSSSLRPGQLVTIEGNLVAELDQEYLVTSIQQSLGLDDGELVQYQMSFTAIPSTVPFRPARCTPKPRLDGVMHAHVDGEVRGRNAPIDADGRYRVVLPFDLYGEAGGRATRWIRMAQPHAGEGYGMHFPLHIGIEVLLVHLDGDPDRPVIVGSIPNRETLTPVTWDNATQSQIRTRSGILVEFEDDA